MRPETYQAAIVILTAIAMCGGAGVLWLWSDRSAKAARLIGGLWLVLLLAGLILGWPWNIGVAAATALAALFLYAVWESCDEWRR